MLLVNHNYGSLFVNTYMKYNKNKPRAWFSRVVQIKRIWS